ncbi:MAG TPA: NrsF family protein [Sphingomicrobium sp.]|nr:NrsF family protein [Sphingomicrobium sp.]
MSRLDALIDALASDAQPVRPLRSPLKRALSWLIAVAALSGALIPAVADVGQLAARYSGREALMVVELSAMLATASLAILGAFFIAIPGRSRRWLLAPVAPFLAWLLLAGAGCFQLFASTGSTGGGVADSLDCLFFILLASLLLGAPLIWLLARARPLEPLPVALLGGLGTAALAAFMLQFFHPFAVTFVDLAVHVLAIALVVAASALLNRRALSAA